MDEYDRLKISLQSALVGMVPDNLFAVTCSLGGKRVAIAAYFEGRTGHEEQELLRHLVKEVLADFPDGYSTESFCYSVQERAPRMLDFWAFLRAEPRKNKAVVSEMPSARVASNF